MHLARDLSRAEANQENRLSKRTLGHPLERGMRVIRKNVFPNQVIEKAVTQIGFQNSAKMSLAKKETNFRKEELKSHLERKKRELLIKKGTKIPLVRKDFPDLISRRQEIAFQN